MRSKHLYGWIFLQIYQVPNIKMAMTQGKAYLLLLFSQDGDRIHTRVPTKQSKLIQLQSAQWSLTPKCKSYKVLYIFSDINTVAIEEHWYKELYLSERWETSPQMLEIFSSVFRETEQVGNELMIQALRQKEPAVVSMTNNWFQYFSHRVFEKWSLGLEWSKESSHCANRMMVTWLNHVTPTLFFFFLSVFQHALWNAVNCRIILIV